ncbi:hypothetical protein [Methylobacterium brachiatum]|uniref:hypothetical protein n=1 Tax=Methylobacterium brachiatum TaxID=269660 RepID=UPI0008EE9DBA|nr:hypothetical protein [Methylobacterium brachiatum]SFJ38634.1 hypothetical protein SAMN02799642_04253 [Methylobacterium brachiatum]
MASIDEDLAQRLWLYARRASEHASNLIPQGGLSAGPLMAVEMIGEGLRAGMLGFATIAPEGIGDLDKVPASLFAIARALQRTGVRDFTAAETEAILLVDRIISAGLERHLIAEELCASAFSHAGPVAWRMAEELRERLAALESGKG